MLCTSDQRECENDVASSEGKVSEGDQRCSKATFFVWFSLECRLDKIPGCSFEAKG